MNSKENEILDNIEFLVVKSRGLLQEQLKSYESANNKVGELISISALVPIVVTFISNSNSSLIIRYLSILPIVLMVIALIYLLRVLMPKGLDHGFNFEQFDKQIDNTHKDLLLFEIGANRDSFKDNTKIVNNQNKNFKTGIKLIFTSAILFFVLVTVSLFVSNAESKDRIIKVETIEHLDINRLNVKTMNDNNSTSDSGASTSQTQQTQQSTQESTKIPSVPREQRAYLEKSDDSNPLTKK